MNCDCKLCVTIDNLVNVHDNSVNSVHPCVNISHVNYSEYVHIESPNSVEDSEEVWDNITGPYRRYSLKY